MKRQVALDLSSNPEDISTADIHSWASFVHAEGSYIGLTVIRSSGDPRDDGVVGPVAYRWHIQICFLGSAIGERDRGVRKEVVDPVDCLHGEWISKRPGFRRKSGRRALKEFLRFLCQGRTIRLGGVLSSMVKTVIPVLVILGRGKNPLALLLRTPEWSPRPRAKRVIGLASTAMINK